jgi:uracil-DNA glycosylase family protein
VDGCRGCGLYRNATQGVFGEGPRDARILLIGEQPGDQEDRAGRPFVGPAGHLLDRALQAAGIAREEVYLTNAVKHFKWIASGKRRLHQKPSSTEVRACRPWLEAELELLKPRVLICLGATAAESIFGRKTAVLANRGKWLESPWCERTLVTVHPSAILRIPDPETKESEFEALVRDLKLAFAEAMPHKS